ncbi:MAG: hypothetical protein R3E21_14265 [Caenibius sp.]
MPVTAQLPRTATGEENFAARSPLQLCLATYPNADKRLFKTFRQAVAPVRRTHIGDGPVVVDPFNKTLPICVDAGVNANEAGFETVALAVVNPPSDSLFAKGGKGRNQLVDCQDILAIHKQTISLLIIIVSIAYGRLRKSYGDTPDPVSFYRPKTGKASHTKSAGPSTVLAKPDERPATAAALRLLIEKIVLTPGPERG